MNCILGLALVIVPLIALGMDEPFIITLATKVAIFAMAGVGLNLVLGYGGLVSFGHAAFFGIGGYAAGILASHALNYEPIMTWPFEIEGTTQMIIIWIVALLASAIIALAIGAITLRTSGVYFIMITLAFAQMIYYFAISWPAYGGEDGLSIYVRNGFPGLNTLDPISYFALCAVMLGLAIAFSAVLIRSRFGLALQGARQNSQRMTAVGIAPFRIRLVAFVISAMITALAGALYADLNRFVSPSMMSWHMSGEIMVFVILGGVGRLFGPLAGAGLYIILEHLLGGVWEFWQLPLGVLLLIVVLFARGGLVGVLAGERKHV
ncbi:MAG TPA: branched-chain amino acid ABC transporter permease [Thalassospira lucentensis]|uniref:Branched-chain amino acid ABC transporter permease n=2 Tax=Thalassospira lucentensis TaxID=168935 RepID=A0A3D5NBS9_9PROT|nr:branched-chain amino acid ABC transporter permease [Thalassospira lucentensis]HCW68560.1 branched-chain amino acid ABC transporter permease [Thalassospira lucentensis]